MLQKALIVFIVGGINIAIDQWSKVWAVNTFKGRAEKVYFDDFFRLTYAENDGAFLSMGSGLEDNWRLWVLSIIPVVILVGFLCFTIFSKSVNKGLAIAYSFIIGGGLSNIYDRINYGYVVDFMNMGIGTLRTGIFNIADLSIIVGIIFYLYYSYRPLE